MMATVPQTKLHEKEKKVLKLEEECLKSLIFQYQSALNALKVEELTLTNRLGQSLDRVRQSQISTPSTLFTNTVTNGTLPTLVSKINTTDIFKPSPVPGNEKLLHLNINRNEPILEEDVESDEEEN